MTLPLFSEPDKAPATPAAPAGPNGLLRPAWSPHRPRNRVACDRCLADLVAAGGIGFLARAARWRRKHCGTEMLLCSLHAQAQRDADGLAPLEDR